MDIPSDARLHNEERYPGSSTLLTISDSATARRFPNGSIDLLLIDATFLNDHARLLPGWRRALSTKSIVLVHENGGNKARFEPSNGLLQEQDECPVIRWPGETSLTTMLTGPKQDDRLMQLASLPPDSPEHQEAQELFSGLGVADPASSTERHQAYPRPEPGRWEEKFQRARERSAQLEEELSVLNKAYNRRSEQVAILNAQVFDLERLQDQRATEIERQRLELADVLSRKDSEIAELKDSLAERYQVELADVLSRKDSEIAELKGSLAERYQELAVLARLLEEQDTAHAKELASLRKAHDELASLRKAHDKAISERDAILESRSWKATAPIRKAITRIRRRSK